jgi:hypothetical protein
LYVFYIIFSDIKIQCKLKKIEILFCLIMSSIILQTLKTLKAKMNSTNNNNNSRKMNSSFKQAYTTFCKVCQDAGKTEKEYTSHNVRDARGTCCPTLLAQECRNCYRKGHTSKYCTQTLSTAVAPVVKPDPKQVKQVKPPVPKNVFMLLESDSEDEKEAEVIKRTEPAPVPHAELKVAQKQALNYGRIITLAPDLVKTEAIAALLKVEKKAAEKKPVKIVVAGPKPKLNWADCDSDSTGDEDEDEDDNYEDNSAW